MSPYRRKLEELYTLEFFGMKLGLENITALLEFLGRPDRRFPSVHVAGTNGKGSVSAMLAAVHQVAGYKTGLYTSPHLVDFRERIRIDGEMISEEEVVSFLERVWEKAKELRATFFEVTTAMAFDHFSRHAVDRAIIETGLGGRLDSTNVLEHPLATVITSIGFDHMAQLGPTLEAIAAEKAGIFKSGVPAVVNVARDLEPVFKRRAAEVHAPLHFVRQHERALARDRYWQSSFAGRHQAENVRTVRTALRAMGSTISVRDARHGIREASLLTGLRGRLEEIVSPELEKRTIRLMIDVGHNAQAFERTRDFFRAHRIRPIVVAGIMKDKEIPAVLKIVKSFARSFVAVQAHTDRALPSRELANAVTSAGLAAVDGGAVLDGLSKAIRQAKKGDTLLLTGSHYVVGEFLENFQRTGKVNTLGAQ